MRWPGSGQCIIGVHQVNSSDTNRGGHQHGVYERMMVENTWWIKNMSKLKNFITQPTIRLLTIKSIRYY